MTTSGFTASTPAPPDNMSLKAELAWHYFFGQHLGSWAAIHSRNGCWIITDESYDLDEAQVYPDDDSFIDWLEEATTEHLEDDEVAFLRQFCLIPGLIDDEIGRMMERKFLS